MSAMTSLEYVTVEVDDPAAAERFYTAAFGLGSPVRLRASEAPTSGFRAFTLSLVVSQPATVDAFVRAPHDQEPLVAVEDARRPEDRPRSP